MFGKIIVHLGYLFFSKIFHKFFKLFYGVVLPPPPPFPPPPPAPELLNFAPNFSVSCLVSCLSTCFSVASLSVFFSFKTIFTPFILALFPSSFIISFFITSTGSPSCMALYNLEFCSAKSTEISAILFSINLKALLRYPPIFSPLFSIISSSFSFSPLLSIPLIMTSFLITLPLLSLLSLIPANIAKLSLYFSSSYLSALFLAMTFSYPSLVDLVTPPPYIALPTRPLSLSLSKDVRPAELNVPAYFSAAFLALSSSAFFATPSFLKPILTPGMALKVFAHFLSPHPSFLSKVLSAKYPPPHLKPYRVGFHSILFAPPKA